MHRKTPQVASSWYSETTHGGLFILLQAYLDVDWNVYLHCSSTLAHIHKHHTESAWCRSPWWDYRASLGAVVRQNHKSLTGRQTERQTTQQMGAERWSLQFIYCRSATRLCCWNDLSFLLNSTTWTKALMLRYMSLVRLKDLIFIVCAVL